MANSNPPISTVYVHNLEERVKVETLKTALEQIFSEYGTIVDIVAKTNLKAKGQAFIVFEKPESALAAVDEVNGFDLFEKPMQVSMARTRSDATVKTNCTDEEFDQHKRRRLAEKDKRKAAEAAEEQKRLKRPGAVPDSGPLASKTARGAGLKSTSVSTSAVIPDEYLPPNKILFVQNIPENCDVEDLVAIFSRFDGFREVRLVPGRRGISFVEYETEQGAITAKENTAGITVGGSSQVIKVTYQRQ